MTIFPLKFVNFKMGCPQSAPKGDISQRALLPAPELASPPRPVAKQQTLQAPSQPPAQSNTEQNTQQSQPPEQPAEQPPEQPPAQPPEEPPAQPTQQNTLPQAVGVNDDETEAFGLLLCGAGESGKTTYTRQLKIKFKGGITEKERLSFVQTIRGNMVETMQQLIFWTERNDKEISSEFEDDVSTISDLNAFDCEFSPQLAEKLKQLWDDPAIQEAFQHKDETIIPDHMDYFYAKIDDLVQDDYIPSDEDVLRARIRSIGIDPVTLYLEGVLIRIYDVGGQKNERSKWDKVMNEVGGVIFCVSLVEYDKPCFEDTSLLRINDALEIFKEITHREQFQEAPFFLICNKYDMFQEKIKNTDSFIKIFPDFTGDPHDPQACQNYIVQKFMDVSNPQSPDRPIIVYTQSSLDSNQVVENTNQICRYLQTHYYD